MSEHTMLKIGEFACLGQVSIVTLRHYDHYGLLKPSALNPQTGYRYYTFDQLARLHRIVALKELGFPLEQIAELLEEKLSLEQLQTMFQSKQVHIQQVIETEQARLAQIAARLRHIEQEGSMPAHEIVLKQFEPLLVATAREFVSLDDNLEALYEHIARYLEEQGMQRARPDMLLRHSHYELRTDRRYTADVELAIRLREPLPGNEHVMVRTLPGGLMACAVHSGGTLSLGRAYSALHSWLDANDYRFAGPPREIYLQHGERLMLDQAAITELRFPVTPRQAALN